MHLLSVSGSPVCSMYTLVIYSVHTGCMCTWASDMDCGYWIREQKHIGLCVIRILFTVTLHKIMELGATFAYSGIEYTYI